jgi:DNA-binding response OmpR family regulator
VDRQRLLVVEDEAAARQLIQTPLGNAGYEMLPADNGREALAILEERPCDLIVADTRTPELDGLALLCALKQRSNEMATAPVGSVLLIGRTDAALAVQAMRLGALDCILKPFDSSSLVASVASAIERSHEIADAWRQDRDSQGLARSEEAETRPLHRRPSARRRSVPPPANDPLVQAHANGDEMLADGDFEIQVKVHFGISNVGSLDAKICRVNAGFIVLSAPSSFALGQRVEVSYRERGIESEIVYSNKQADGSFPFGTRDAGRQTWSL